MSSRWSRGGATCATSSARGEQNRWFSVLAAGYQRACGCGSGRLFLAIAVAAMIGYLVTHHRAVDLELWHGAAALVVAGLAAITGKLAGLLWARLRLLMLLAAVHRACRAQQRMTVTT
jgi:hypothetical protein